VIDLTGRYELPSTESPVSCDQQHGTRHSTPSEAATTTSAAPPTSSATHELLCRSAVSLEASDRDHQAAKVARRSTNLRDGVKDSEMRSHRHRACRHGVGKWHSPILRPGKCRSRPQKAHDQLGVRLRPSSPNGLLGDGERQQRKLSTERARHVTWCCGRPEVGLGSKERVKSSLFRARRRPTGRVRPTTGQSPISLHRRCSRGGFAALAP